MEKQLERLKTILREDAVPFFEDDQLLFYLEENGDDLRTTAYRCLLIKAEDTTLQVSGLNAADSSKYFRRLASQYRPNNSGTLTGG